MRRRWCLVLALWSVGLCTGWSWPAQAAESWCGPQGQSFYIAIKHVVRNGSTPEFRYFINDTDLTIWMRRGYEPDAAWSNLPGLGWQRVLIFQYQNGDGPWTINAGDEATALQVCTERITAPTAGGGNTVSYSSNPVQISNQSKQSVQTGAWPPGGEPAVAAPSPGFPWHTLVSIADWLMRAIWVVSTIAGLFAPRRRSQVRRE